MDTSASRNAEIDTLKAAAEAAVVAAEAVALGGPWKDPVGDAVGAVGDLEAPCRAVVFPAKVAPAADEIRELEFFSGPWRHSEFQKHFEELHEQAIDTHPRLASLMRTYMVQTWLEAHVRVAADRAGIDLTYAEETLEALQRRLASQLLGRTAFEPYAAILAETVPALAARIAAVSQRHRDHASHEEARVLREQQEHQAQVARAEKAEQDELAAFFQTRAGRVLEWSNAPITGSQIAASLRGEASHYFNGEPMSRISVEAATLLRRRVEAAERVTA